MNLFLSSRRWLIQGALAACGILAVACLVHAQTDSKSLPKGYTKPTPVTDLSRAPGLQVRKVSEQPNGEKVYALVFGTNDDVMSGLTAFAVREKITAGHLSGIGGFSRAKFGWFDFSKKAYRDIPIDGQAEVITLTGDIGMFNGKPQVHVHGAVGLPDGRMCGGHLLEAIVNPTLEIYVTVVPAMLVKKWEEKEASPSLISASSCAASSKLCRGLLPIPRGWRPCERGSTDISR